MFPDAGIPVLQLSMDYSRPPSDHYALARQLKGLRERGVLIVGSGNIVHNLRQAQRGAAGHQAYDWALEFDQTTGGYIQQGNLDALQNFQKLGQLALMAHPTHEHYLPLLYAAAAVDAHEAPRFFNTSFQFGSISMRSVIWG
jgi:4,5-DOPA dioxygenase extradiol